MKTNHKYVINPRFQSWVIAIIIFLTIFYQPGTAQNEHPNWIAYDIGKVHSVSSLASEKDTLWIACFEKGLIKLNKITHEYTSYNLTDYGFNKNWVQSIVVDKNGNKWFLSMEGLVKFDGLNFTLYDSLGNINDEYIISYIKRDHQGNIWVKGSGKMAMFDGHNWTVYSTKDTTSIFYNITDIAFDSSGHLWAGTWDHKIREIDNFKLTNFKSDSITHYLDINYYYNIIDIEISKNGIKWIILQDFFTGWCALIKYIDESNLTITDAYINRYDYLPSPFTFTIESDSCIWIGGWDYFRWYDGEESWKYYTFARGNKDYGAEPIIIDEYGNKWIGVSEYFNTNDDNPLYIVCFREGGVKLGVDEDPQVIQPRIFPNPARDYIYINSSLIDGAGGVWQYQIYDILGNCVQSGAIESDKININQLSSGFYTVRFFNGGKQVVEKMMKE